MKRLFALPLAALILTACEAVGDDDRFTTCPNGKNKSYIISFESLTDCNGQTVVPGHATATGFIDNEYDGVFWGKPYAREAQINVFGDTMSDYMMYHGLLFSESIARFGSYYDDGMQWGSPYDTWDGFVVSQICDSEATGVDYANQFSVWAAAGANGTRTFAVGYCPDTNYIDTTATPYMIPTIEFTAECDVRSLWVANSTVAYPYVPAAGDKSLTLIISAWRGAAPVGETRVELAGESGKLDDWTKVEFAFEGKVDRLTFGMESGDELYPTYFCIDEIEISWHADAEKE